MLLEQEKLQATFKKELQRKNILMFYISGLAWHYLIIENPLKPKAVCSRSLHICVMLVSLDSFQNFGGKNMSAFTDEETILFSLGCYQSLFCLPCTHLLTSKDSLFNSMVCTATGPLQIRPQEGTGTGTSLTLPFSKNEMTELQIQILSFFQMSC